YAAAAEDPHSLPASASQHAVNRANSTSERLTDHGSRQRQWSVAAQDPMFAGVIGALRIQRLPRPVNHAAQKSGAHSKRRMRATRHDPVAVTDTNGPFEGHREDQLVAKADDFTCERTPFGRQDRAAFSHRAERSFGFDEIVDNFRHSAHPAQSGKVIEAAKEGRQRAGPRHSLTRGRCSSKSRNPCSISLSCVSKLM